MAGITIEVGIEGLDSLFFRMEGAPDVLDRETRQAMEDATRNVEYIVKVLTPVETGYLRGSIKTQSSANYTELQGRVFTEVSYAPFVEEGHGEILPKRGKYLRFRPKGSASYVFARRVRPVEGVHMFSGGMELAMPAVVERFKLAMQAVAKFIATRGP